MIEVNGKQFITLNDEMFVNGQKVMRAYANGSQVYPSGGGTLIKFRGESSLSTVKIYYTDPKRIKDLLPLNDVTVVHSFRGSFVACIRCGYYSHPFTYGNHGLVIQNYNEKRGFDDYSVGFPEPTAGGIAMPTLSVTGEYCEGAATASGYKYHWKGLARANIGYLHAHDYYQKVGSYNTGWYTRYDFHWVPDSYPPWLNGEVMRIDYPGYSEAELTVDSDNVWSQSIHPLAESPMDGSVWAASLDTGSVDGRPVLANGMRINMSVPVENMVERCIVTYDPATRRELSRKVEASGKFSDMGAGGEIGYMPIKQILYYGDYDTAPDWAKNVYESDL